MEVVSFRLEGLEVQYSQTGIGPNLEKSSNLQPYLMHLVLI